MKLSRVFLQKMRIPTKGMEEFEIVRGQKSAISTGLWDEIRYTRFYRNLGQLEDNAFTSSGEELLRGFYVQREDGYVAVGWGDIGYGGISFATVKPHLDPDVKATVIACRLPASQINRYELRYRNSEYGALEFLAQCHPSPVARVAAIAKLMEMYPTPERTREEQFKYQEWVRVLAKEVGIPCA